MPLCDVKSSYLRLTDIIAHPSNLENITVLLFEFMMVDFRSAVTSSKKKAPKRALQTRLPFTSPPFLFQELEILSKVKFKMATEKWRTCFFRFALPALFLLGHGSVLYHSMVSN